MTETELLDSTRNGPIRILVVDDHEFVRKGICSVLATERSMTLCGEAVDGQDAIEKACALRPDVVVMDISMPRLNGLEAAREIKRLVPEAEIVIVTQHENPEMVKQAAKVGARGYVVKSSISSELIGAISKVKQGNGFVNRAELAPLRRILDAEGILKRSATLERALGNSEERFRSAMNNMAEGLYMLDLEGRATYVNPSAARMFGYFAEELVGQNPHQMMAGNHPNGELFAQVSGVSQGVLQTGVPVREQVDVFIRKDGTPFSVLFSCSPIKNDNRTIGLVVCFRENSEGHRSEEALPRSAEETETAERQLRQSVETLEARVSERTRELAQATQKLRELSASLLQTQDEERRRIARELHDGIGQYMVALNMNLSRISRERGALSSAASHALDENCSLVEEALQQIRTMSHLLHPPLLDEVGIESALRWYVEGFAQRSKIQVSMDMAVGFGEQLPRDLGLSLFRIVQECLTNIHRHSGSLTALIAIDRSPQEIVVKVEDQGTGISGEKQVKIFSGGSSGVGLRGMQERVRQFGGRLEVQSSPAGTKITAVIPFPSPDTAQQQDTASPEVEAQPTTESSSTTVLCIDDDPNGLAARRMLLESAGYQVLEARSGAEGIKQFQSRRVDAVILDYWMTEMKGTMVASELKRLDPRVPIIVLSGMSDLPGEAVGLIDRWLVKGSYRGEKLLESLSSLMEHRASPT